MPGRLVAWISLDEGDNDPARFLAYTVAACQSVATQTRQTNLEALDPAVLTAIEPALIALINALADLRPGAMLVLDDYHLIESWEIHSAVHFLLDHLPPSLHLVIATRADPPLSLAQLRARGQLTELRYEELRFTPHEVTAFLNAVMRLNLAPEDVQALDARTEGWIAGLQLAALSLRGRADVQDFIATFSSSHHFVLEYLSGEVLVQLPMSLQRFMLQTSILDRLCGPLCDTVTGDEDGEVQLARIYQDNLFLIPLDEERRWYRYHPLFADLLRKRLLKETGSEKYYELCQRASRWHEEHGSLDEAVNYALQAGDFERVVRMVEEAASAGFLESRLSTMLRWLDAVPEAQLLSRPQLCIYQAWALVINEQLDRALEMLRKSSRVLAAAPPIPGSETAHERLVELLTVVELMASLLAAAYSGQDLDQLCQTVEAVRDRALETGNIFIAAHVVNGLAMGRFHQGRLTAASVHYHELVEFGHQGSGSQLLLAAVGHVGLASVAVERDQREAAEGHLEEAARLGRHRIGTNTLVSAAIARSRLRESAGDRQTALICLDEVERIGRVNASPPALHRLARQRLRLLLSAGELDRAESIVQSLGRLFATYKPGEAPPPVFREAQQILQARVSLYRGDSARALESLNEPERMARAGKRSGRLIEIYLLQALAFQALSCDADAVACVERSLALAESEGYVRVYLDEWEQAAALLRLFYRHASPPAHLVRFARRLLEMFESLLSGTAAAVLGAPPALVEQLTRREGQVLQLLATGLSAPEIARELVVAPSTVRSHLKRVYGKLGVHSRHEAIARGRTLGLV
jgi:LuxR family maltose regulon positive regulatory protein